MRFGFAAKPLPQARTEYSLLIVVCGAKPVNGAQPSCPPQDGFAVANLWAHQASCLVSKIRIGRRDARLSHSQDGCATQCRCAEVRVILQRGRKNCVDIIMAAVPTSPRAKLFRCLPRELHLILFRRGNPRADGSLAQPKVSKAGPHQNFSDTGRFVKTSVRKFRRRTTKGRNI